MLISFDEIKLQVVTVFFLVIDTVVAQLCNSVFKCCRVLQILGTQVPISYNDRRESMYQNLEKLLKRLTGVSEIKI